MLQKYFKHGDKKSAFKAKFSSKVGVSASIEYQLGMTDANGNERNFAPEIVKGDVNTYTEVTLNGNFKNEYTAGVLRFVEKDIEMDTLQDIMKGHEEMTFPGLEPHQYVALWILHKDKDGVELHFNYGKEELTTGKKLKPFVFNIDIDRMDAYKNYVNAKYDFADPNDPKYKQDYAINDNKLPTDVEDIKDHINQYVSRMIDADLVYDRQSLVEALDSHQGVNVSRTTKNAVSIEVKDRSKPIRLKGQVYQEDFTKETLSEEYKASLSERFKEERPMRAEEEYEKATSLWQKRAKENKEFYRIDPAKLLKAELQVEVEDLIMEGKVNERKEIADYIRQNEQVEEVREDVKHHLSVKMKDKKRPFRLDDDIFKRDFSIPAYREEKKEEANTVENKKEEPQHDPLKTAEEEYLEMKKKNEQFYFTNEYGSTNFVRMKDSRWNDVANNIDNFLNTSVQLNENYGIIYDSNEEKATDFDLSMFKAYSQSTKERVDSNGINNNNNKEKDYGREPSQERQRSVIQKITQRSKRERRGFVGIVGKVFERASGREKEQRRIDEAISRNSEANKRNAEYIQRSNRSLTRGNEVLRGYREEAESNSGSFKHSLSKLEDYVDKMRIQLNEEKKSEFKKKTRMLSLN